MWSSFPLFFRILGSMYRTKDDLQLKRTRQSGPPFFDLRESISMIFNGFMRESKVCDRKTSISQSHLQNPPRKLE